MNIIKNLSFRKKLLALVVPPILGAIFFSGINLLRAVDEKGLVDQINPLVELSISGSLIVHELQKERGASAGFVGSKGAAFSDILRSQRQTTDKVLAEQLTFITSMEDYFENQQPEVYRQLTKVISTINTLSQHRSSIDKLSITAPQSAKFYTDLNADILGISGTIATLSTHGDLTNKLRNYYTFLQAKESAGQERATLNIAISMDYFSPGLYQKVVTLDASQKTNLKTFAQFASADLLTELENMYSSSAVKRVNEIKQITNQNYIEGKFGVQAEEWFKVSTERINQMKSIEDKLADNIHVLMLKLDNSASNEIMFSSAITITLLLLTIVLTTVISRLIVKQALQLAETIDNVAAHKDLSLRASVLSNDELGSSAKSFNDMLAGFSDMLRNIETSSGQLAHAAKETSISVAESAASLEKQSLETAQAATSTEQMTATVSEIASNTTLTAESANRAADLSFEGVQVVEANTSSMNELNEKMAQANTQVIELRESSNEINEIVDVIKSVAEQTNLLALNAAIEAARAGEHGRGFAVVADEVRTLASRTQESTQRIEEMIIRFQSEADSVSQSIETSFGHVQASLEQTHSVKDKLSEINLAIESIKDMSNQVATAAEQQVAATNEIAMNIRTINELAELGAETGGHISKAANEQTELCSRQNELISLFKQ